MNADNIADRLDAINARGELARAATCSLLAEGVAVTLFLAMLFVWYVIGATP